MARTFLDTCTYEGLSEKLSSADFIKNLGLMFDAAEELKDLSEELQNKDIHLSEAIKKLEDRLTFFQQRLRQKRHTIHLLVRLLKKMLSRGCR